MGILNRIKEGGAKMHRSFELEDLYKDLPILILGEEILFRLIPFTLLPIKWGFILSLTLHLVTHAWDRRIHKTNYLFITTYLLLHTILTAGFAAAYLYFGFWGSFLVHFFYDFLIIRISDEILKRKKAAQYKTKGLGGFSTDPRRVVGLYADYEVKN